MTQPNGRELSNTDVLRRRKRTDTPPRRMPTTSDWVGEVCILIRLDNKSGGQCGTGRNTLRGGGLISVIPDRGCIIPREEGLSFALAGNVGGQCAVEDFLGSEEACVRSNCGLSSRKK